MKNIFIVSVVLIFISCSGKKTAEVNKTETSLNESLVRLSELQLKSADISLSKLEPKSISSILKANGTIDVPPQHMVSVSMPLGGYLKSTKLLPGMRVRKGEIIALMEDQQYIQLQQEYLTTKTKLTYSKFDLERQKELNQSKANSDKVYQQSQMEYNTLTILLNSLAQKLRLININPDKISETNISRTAHILSPINGFVSKVNVNIGKFVNPSDVLFELIDPSSIHFNLKVCEKDLGKLVVGQKLYAYTNMNPEKKYLCEISLITGNISADRTAEVHCHFENFDKALVPGMYMNADIEIKSNKSLVIDEDAIINFEGKNYIFVKTGDKQFEMKEVKTGAEENQFVEILNGETFSGKEVVTKGAYTLLMVLKNKSEE